MRPILKPLGDQAILAYLPDEAAAVGFAAAVRAAGFAWLVDVVAAYASVGVFFDAAQTDLAAVRQALARVRPRGRDAGAARHISSRAATNCSWTWTGSPNTPGCQPTK